MGLWDTQVQEHATAVTIRHAVTLATALTDVPNEALEVANRVAHALRYVMGLVEHCDPQLLTPTMLDAPLSAARTIEAECQAFGSDHDPTHIHQANAAVDQLLDVIRSWPGFTTGTEEIAAARDALATVEHACAEALLLRGEESRSLEGNVAELQEDLAQARSSFDEMIASARAQADALQASAEQRLADLAATVETQKARLDQAIADYQAQFSSAQEERRRAADELGSSQAAEFQSHMKQLSDESDAELEARRSEAQAVLDQINNYREQAGKVTEAIGITGMAEGFRKDADEQKNAADWLRFGAIAALVSAAALAIWAATATHGGKFQGSVFIARIVVSGAVGSIATYLIIQSAHHRERERRARKVELELASIDPYLAMMPPEISVDIKKKLADAWFGQPSAPIEDVGGAHAASIPIAEFIQAVIKLGSK